MNGLFLIIVLFVGMCGLHREYETKPAENISWLALVFVFYLNVFGIGFIPPVRHGPQIVGMATLNFLSNVPLFRHFFPPVVGMKVFFKSF